MDDLTLLAEEMWTGDFNKEELIKSANIIVERMENGYDGYNPEWRGEISRAIFRFKENPTENTALNLAYWFLED